MSFSTNGYEIVKNVISNDLLNHLKIQFEMMRDIKFFTDNTSNKYAYGDRQTRNSFSVYSAPFFESLAIQLRDKMSKITNFDLYPTYTYARIYYKGAILAPHIDSPRCEYSTTICIHSTDIWNFYIKDKSGKKITVKLNPGDMCVYSGCELMHWRELYEGEMQMQCFLHYVNSKGPYANLKYDGRSMMGIRTLISKKIEFYINEKTNRSFS
jgi:hypothetical protein